MGVLIERWLEPPRSTRSARAPVLALRPHPPLPLGRRPARRMSVLRTGVSIGPLGRLPTPRQSVSRIGVSKERWLGLPGSTRSARVLALRPHPPLPLGRLPARRMSVLRTGVLIGPLGRLPTPRASVWRIGVSKERRLGLPCSTRCARVLAFRPLPRLPLERLPAPRMSVLRIGATIGLKWQRFESWLPSPILTGGLLPAARMSVSRIGVSTERPVENQFLWPILTGAAPR